MIWAPWLTGALLLGPVLAGLAGVLLPAFGILPALGGTSLTLDPWRGLLGWPGFWPALRLSFVTGMGATVLALGLTLLIVGALHGTRAFAYVLRALSPLLAVPHAAAAFALAFLIAPSGWLVRAVSPGLTGWQAPPDLLIVNDPMGLALIAGLVLKEVPFLLLMTIAALGQADAPRMARVAGSLGYGRVSGWFKVVLPRIYPQIRLPVWAVLAYGVSVVDMALILGPTRPPTLAVQLLVWMNDPDLSRRFQAAAAAVAQGLLVVFALALWRLAEAAVARAGRRWIMAGGRGRGVDAVAGPVAGAAAAGIAGVMLLGMLGLALWSVAGLWPFPDVVPQGMGLQVWRSQGGDLLRVGGATLLIGTAAVAVALVLVVACLENEYRSRSAAPQRALWLLYLPLIVPQVAFLPGVQILALMAGLDGGTGAVMAAHLVFVLPYVFLSLSDPWRAWDGRMGLMAQALGAGPARVLFMVRLPMLLRPLLVAAAVGFAVSVGQYLPTLLIGAGRVETLTTEAVALASGGNRRVIGVYALVQMLAPLCAFLLALLVPAWLFRNRRGLQT